MNTSEQGVALLEFCLVLPLLLLFVWGILAFALYVIESHMLHFAAYVAARTALTDGSEAGENAAANFLAISRRELFWFSEPIRKLSGRQLKVEKRGKRVDVEIGREETRFARFLAWVAGRPALDKTFNQLFVAYAIGRGR